MTEATKTWAHDTDHCVVSWDRVLIHVWCHATTRDAIANLERYARAFIAEQPPGQKICSLGIVERTSPPPGDQVRSDLSRFFRELMPQLNAAIIVPEGGGFRAAMVRGVGVALSTLAPRSLPFTFADSIPSAAQRIAPFLSPRAGGAATLETVIEQARTLAGVVERR